MILKLWGLASLTVLPLYCCSGPTLSAQEDAAAPPTAAAEKQVPTRLYEVVKVVDGDTVHIHRDGKVEKLRLLCVDTEEKFSSGASNTPSKPQTVFGEECALWAQAYFAEHIAENGKQMIGLRFPNGEEKRGNFGRLLCHVIMPDGTDFNLLLVELGKSPYFNKYGNSRICHEAFVRAQAQARKQQLGVWNPETNAAATEGAPSAKRPYAELLPWWQARADAIDAFRARHAKSPGDPVDAEDGAQLETAAKHGKAVEVFGSPSRIFDERDGSRTVLFRGSDKARALRVFISADKLEEHTSIDLDGLLEYGRQNYTYVSGVITRGERGFELRSESPKQWRRGGSEPKPPTAD